jgi:hypothetical protein
MLRRSSVSAFILIVAFVLGGFLMSRQPTVTAQAPAGRGKCVGMAVHSTVIYRVFEDGTVEGVNTGDGASAKQWFKVGQ